MINTDTIRIVERIVLQILAPSDGQARRSGYYWQTLNYPSKYSDFTVKQLSYGNYQGNGRTETGTVTGQT